MKKCTVPSTVDDCRGCSVLDDAEYRGDKVKQKQNETCCEETDLE